VGVLLPPELTKGPTGQLTSLKKSLRLQRRSSHLQWHYLYVFIYTIFENPKDLGHVICKRFLGQEWRENVVAQPLQEKKLRSTKPCTPLLQEDGGLRIEGQQIFLEKEKRLPKPYGCVWCKSFPLKYKF